MMLGEDKSEQALSARVVVALTPGEYLRIKSAATEAGVSVSAFGRQSILEILGQEG